MPKGLVGRLFDRRFRGGGRIGLRRGFARHLRDGGGELIGGIGRGEAGGRHQESAARQADVVAAGGRHDDRIGARRLDLAKHGGALEAPHVGAGDERGGDRGVIGGGGGVDLLHRGGGWLGGADGRKAGLTDEEGGGRQV